MSIEVTLYCEHVNGNHVHCNRTKTLSVTNLEAHFPITQKIMKSEWSIEDNELHCPTCTEE